MLRQRQLHDVARARRVGVEAVDLRFELLLRSLRRKVNANRLDADLGAVAVLARDVPLRAGVVADEDRAQAGHDAPPRERGYALTELGFDLCRGLLAVECGSRHASPRPG